MVVGLCIGWVKAGGCSLRVGYVTPEEWWWWGCVLAGLGQVAALPGWGMSHQTSGGGGVVYWLG